MKSSHSFRRRARTGFTLIELMVVILIIGILLAMIFPGINSMLESANATACQNNMREVHRAIMAFQNRNNGVLPGSWNSTPTTTGSDDINGWSAQARLLPYLEQNKLFQNIDFSQSYSTSIEIVTADGSTTSLGAVRVPVYLCPSEVKDEVRYSGGEPIHYPINYAVNLGTWLVYDPANDQGGDGAFYPDSRLKLSAFKDGANETVCLAEVKGWNPYYRNAAKDLADLENAIPDPTAADYLDICSLEGDFKQNSGHTEWIDGRAHQTGFTSVYTPNARVMCDESGDMYDVDWTNWQEGKGLGTGDDTPTFAAVTARSYHPGGVNVVMMGNSVHQVSDDIDPLVWRAYTTRAGNEVIGNDNRL